MTVLSTSQEQLDTIQSAIHRLACLLVVRLVQHQNHNMAALPSQQEQLKIAQLKSYLHQMLERHPSNQKKYNSLNGRLEKQRLYTEAFKLPGLIAGHGFTMTHLMTRHSVTFMLQPTNRI